MSGLGAALVTIGGTIEDILLRGKGRKIGAIVPNVVIEEDHTDELMITQHPVETGADITDHAVKLPAQITMRCGFSQSGSNTPGIGFLSPSPKEVYQMFLDLQATRQPFDVVTGKRKYKNMLIKRLSTLTDGESENCLLVDVDLQEIITVDTVTRTGPNVPNLQNVADPAANGPLVNTGTQQAIDVTELQQPMTVIDLSTEVP